MSLITKLHTLFTGGSVTVTENESAALTKAQARSGLALTFSGNNTVKLATNGSSIAGQLVQVDPYGDRTVTMQVTGYVKFPVQTASQASVAVDDSVNGYVVGANNGEVKVLAAFGVTEATIPAAALQVLNRPLKIVEVLDSGAFVVVDLGAKIS